MTGTGIEEVTGKKHLVNEIVVNLSGWVNPVQANNPEAYRVSAANRRGSWIARELEWDEV